MKINRLATTYRRSISVTLPDGREAWVAHEALIEATFEEGELIAEAIPANFDNLRQIAMKEVSQAIKREKDALMAAHGVQPQTDEPFPSQDTALANLPRL